MSIEQHLALNTVAVMCCFAFGVEGALFAMFLMGYSLGKDVT